MIKVFSTSAVLLGIACGSMASAQATSEPAVLPPPSSGLPLLAPADAPTDAVLTAPPETVPVILTQTSPNENSSGELQLVAAIVDASVPTPSWYNVGYWFGPAPWDIGFELGLNGSQGQNETFSMRTGGHLRRETEFWKIDTSISYYKNTANSLETQNDAKFDARFDRLLGDSPWTLFFMNNVLYDEFQPFDIRFALNAGLGYQLIDTERVNLIGRVGAGASREFGGPDDRWAQEALFGLEYEHELSKTQRLTAKVDYFPEWKDFGQYRVVSDFGWEIDLDFPSNTSLKLSVQDRYDSTPNGVDPNNLDYAVLLIWGL